MSQYLVPAAERRMRRLPRRSQSPASDQARVHADQNLASTERTIFTTSVLFLDCAGFCTAFPLS